MLAQSWLTAVLSSRMSKRKAASQDVAHEGKVVSKIQRTPDMTAIPNVGPSRLVMFVNTTRGPVDIIFAFGTLVDHALWASLNSNLAKLCDQEKKKFGKDFAVLVKATKAILYKRLLTTLPASRQRALRRNNPKANVCVDCSSVVLEVPWKRCWTCSQHLIQIEAISRGCMRTAGTWLHEHPWLAKCIETREMKHKKLYCWGDDDVIVEEDDE
jgi:hypothetical protein